MGLLAGCQALLERQTFVLLGLLSGGGGLGQLIEGFGVQLLLLGDLAAIAPVLKLPGTTGTDQHQRQRSDQAPRCGNHGTSLKKTCPPSLSVCFAFAAHAGGVFMLSA